MASASSRRRRRQGDGDRRHRRKPHARDRPKAPLDRSRRARAGRRGRLVGRQVGLRAPYPPPLAGEEEGAREFEAPSTVGGLAFLPKGFRLAVAHYNGATLWFPNAPQAEPEKLEWKGSHLGATVSPDGRFLVTTMQEPMLHGWRLVDRKHMRMSGYAARVTSFGWTAGGRWLATSGATQLILWPFQSKDGPMGKQPRLLAPSEHRVAVVACHPRQDGASPPAMERRRPPEDGGAASGAHRRRRRDFGEKTRRRAGHGARLERRRPSSGVGHGKRRGRDYRPRLMLRSHIAAAAGSR
jgi:hypothetical protein